MTRLVNELASRVGAVVATLGRGLRWLLTPVSPDTCPYCKTSLSEGDHDDCRKHWGVR